jgi:hypothetical protein
MNQLRQKIGVVYGNPETTTGGNALEFYCSVRLDIRRKKPIKRGDETIGSECKGQGGQEQARPPFPPRRAPGMQQLLRDALVKQAGLASVTPVTVRSQGAVS